MSFNRYIHNLTVYGQNFQYIAEENRKKQELANCRLADFEIKSTLGNYITMYLQMQDLVLNSSSYQELGALDVYG